MVAINQLYLQGCKVNGEEQQYRMTLESFLTLFVFKAVGDLKNVNLYLVDRPGDAIDCGVVVTLPDVKWNYGINESIASACQLPILFVDANTVIAGLCGVCRGIIKQSLLERDNSFSTELLGFKSACLLSPTESSIWTKFCEIDIIKCTKKILFEFNGDGDFSVPDEILKFESHMSQPVRTHNVYKLARNLQRKKTIVSSTPIIELNIEHTFAESHKITLADAILFPCYNLIYDQIGTENASELPTPLTRKWFETIRNYENGLLSDIYHELKVNNYRQQQCRLPAKSNFIFNQIESYSLYKSDPKRYKPRNRIYTKQEDLEKSLNKLENVEFDIDSKTTATPGREIDFDWSDIPYDALPEGGNLPANRLERKKDQLENLAREVIAIAKDNNRIVDFCSGTGHLGILLACKLPKCTIILVENKEESLIIAKRRSEKLKLTNILFFQCNLDYFAASFDIGTSLHACGVATDIVLHLCFNASANFVCSPCCYGKILEMPHIQYPRSLAVRELVNYSEYLFIAHCADQTHDVDNEKVNVEKSLQGEHCMDVVDTDRIMHAKERGYTVILSRMIPEKCSLKNRLLIGFK